ncbi:SPOR domain-containing protein [Phenylobacterium montanum]|uniref:SPOR domain-containing protein n=1 Tax=Phenylobacterium montanum TaxID=2823693 RepID=A0A975FZZ7_9CAUL|nr:SPOR domain-containing protein [Caulobacter sp. S6]QUD88390.1 SPOR domain-containing protein [Caulobacter sp. S6]
MTDHDRGAYTPQTDAPLAFDARHSRGGGGGGPAPMTLIVSAIVLLLLIIALLLFYRSGVRHSGQAPQVVGAPVAQTKSTPPADSSAPSAGAGLQIYKSDGAPPPSAAPTFAPAPEQPQARPAPPPPTAVPVAPVASAPLRPAQTETAPAAKPAPLAPKAEAPPAAAAAKPAKVASLTPAKPKPAAVAAPKAEAPAAGEPLVQIGAFSSAALAEKGWNDTALIVPGKMAGKTSKVEKADRDGKTFYRAFVGGFSSHADAVSFCVALKAAGKQCMVR